MVISPNYEAIKARALELLSQGDRLDRGSISAALVVARDEMYRDWRYAFQARRDAAHALGKSVEFIAMPRFNTSNLNKARSEIARELRGRHPDRPMER